MPPLVRLPADVPEGECRLYWGTAEDWTASPSLCAWGPSSACRMLLDHFGGRPQVVEADFGMGLHLREIGVLKEGKPFTQQLEEAGYDLTTLTFSIRKKGFEQEADGSPVDVPGHLDRAWEAIGRLKAALKEADQAKNVLVFDEVEVLKLEELADEAQAEIASAMEKAA